jgi:hypothetical protein
MFSIECDSFFMKKIMLFGAAVVLFATGALLVAPTEKLLQRFIDLANIAVTAFG